MKEQNYDDKEIMDIINPKIITFRFAFREMRLLNDAWALVYQVFYKYQELLG